MYIRGTKQEYAVRILAPRESSTDRTGVFCINGKVMLLLKFLELAYILYMTYTCNTNSRAHEYEITDGGLFSFQNHGEARCSREKSEIMNEIIPESPDKELDEEDENLYVPETPQKFGSPLIKSKNVIPIPSFNRIRKSLGILDNNGCFSEDNFIITSPKTRRIDKCEINASKKTPKRKSFNKSKFSNLQKVKVSLFHSRFQESEVKKPSFSFNAKSFYGHSVKKAPESFALAPMTVEPVDVQNSRKRKSSTAQSVGIKKKLALQPIVKKRSPTQIAAMKKQKKGGEINCGVGHGIKKPKLKRNSLKNDSMDSNKSLSDQQNNSITAVHIPIEINPNQSENIDIGNIVQSSVELCKPKFFKNKNSILNKSLKKKIQTKNSCKEPENIEGLKIADNCTISITNEYLGLSENDGELFIEPLINQMDINEWQKLTNEIDFHISDTNVSNLESIDQVDDLLKILEDDWIDSAAIPTLDIRTINTFSSKEANDILEDISIDDKSSSTNFITNNIENINSANESIVVKLNNTVNLPVDLPLSASTVIESHSSNLFSCKSIDKKVNANVTRVSVGIDEPLNQNIMIPVIQKDVTNHLNILQDNFVQNIEHKGNFIHVKCDTYKNIMINENVTQLINNSLESQNSDVIIEQKLKEYPILSTESSCGIVTNVKNQTCNANRIMKESGDLSQNQIAVREYLHGMIQCKECEYIYNSGDKEDEKQHNKHHNMWKANSRIKFPGWKNERIVYKDATTDSKIILIEPSDPISHRKKIIDIFQKIDEGLIDENSIDNIDDNIYCYVRKKLIVGLLISKRIHSAFRVIPESPELMCCSTENSPVKCGIDVIWTAASYRRQGIATKLVDILRTNYFYGYEMSIDDIAFSMPTPSGRTFAENYTKISNFKVY